MTPSSSVDYLAKLVAFPTVSRDSNLDLIDFVRAEIERLGGDCRLVASEDGNKANLFATIGPQDRQGILLSGHSDVVPTEGQAWSSDPFTLRHAEGRLHARGSADMKGFIACCLTMLGNARQRRLVQPLHLAVSYDEEVGCLGVRRLIDMIEGLPVQPRFCIVGEPTSLQVVTAHKGKVGMRVACRGLEAHSSIAPTTVNAVHLACDLIARIRAIQAAIAATGAKDCDYVVPYTTLHAGNIAGGEVINIVPNHCRFEYEIRYIPEDDPQPIVRRIEKAADEIVADARQLFDGAAIVFTPAAAYPALNTNPDSEVVSFVRALTGGNSLGKISFGTEGGLFQERLGVPTVVCGPGDIAVAHKPDEYVEESQMAACDRFLARLLDSVSI
ncbi:MAG: acetylornithine deacetylase [Pseudomonadota bacterium]|nr:acetylornithine deacetylase [Pseudomonadota bacterium]